MVEPHVDQKCHPRSFSTLHVTLHVTLTLHAPAVAPVPVPVLGTGVVPALGQFAGRAVKPPTVKRRVFPLLRPRQVHARPWGRILEVVLVLAAHRSKRACHRLAVVHRRGGADEHGGRAVVGQVRDGAHVRVHVEVVTFQRVVLIPVQADGVVRRVDDLRPPLGARAVRVEGRRRVRVVPALILPFTRRVRHVQVEYLLREVLQGAPRRGVGGYPERLTRTVLTPRLLPVLPGLLLDAPGGEDPAAVCEDACVQIFVLVQPLDEVGEGPEGVEREAVHRGGVHATVLSHRQLQLFTVVGVVVGVGVLFVVLIGLLLIGVLLIGVVLLLLLGTAFFVVLHLLVRLETLGIVAIVLDVSSALLAHSAVTPPGVDGASSLWGKLPRARHNRTNSPPVKNSAVGEKGRQKVKKVTNDDRMVI